MKFQKRIQYLVLVNSIFNLLTFVCALILVGLAIGYKLWLVSNNYQNTTYFTSPKGYRFFFDKIALEGLSSLFTDYWEVIMAFYILTLLFAILNFLLSLLMMSLSFKYKNSTLLKTSVMLMFGSIIGVIYSWKTHQKWGGKINFQPKNNKKKEIRLEKITASLMAKMKKPN